MLKPDEVYAMKTLVKHFKQTNVNVEIIEGDDPPDLIAIRDGVKIPLEVTCAENKTIGKEGIGNRVSQDMFFINLCISIDKDLGIRIPSNKTLSLFIEGPTSNGAKFKVALKHLIQSIVEDEAKLNALQAHPLSTVIEDVPIKIKLFEDLPYRKRIVGVISNRNGILNIVLECSIVLRDRVRDKDAKIHQVNGEKWLVILNHLVLADEHNFIEALSDLEIKHSFTKIYLIDDGKVFELFSAPPGE